MELFFLDTARGNPDVVEVAFVERGRVLPSCVILVVDGRGGVKFLFGLFRALGLCSRQGGVRRVGSSVCQVWVSSAGVRGTTERTSEI